MATTRGWKLRGNINAAINYILDLKHGEAKTGSGIYTTSSYGSESGYRAGYCFKQKRVNIDNPSKNVGYHFQFSLPPGEGTPEDCLAAAEEWINMISGSMADYVIAVHLDTSSLHAHIVTDYYLKDGKPWAIYWKRDRHKFRAAADMICQKYGFSILEKTKEKGKSYYDWLRTMNPDSSRIMLMKILDYAIPRVKSFEDLQKYLETFGFKVFGSEDKELYSFFADRSAVKNQPDGNYQVKLQGHPGYIEVDRAFLKWIKSGTLAKITLPLNGNLKWFNDQMFYAGQVKVSDLKKEREMQHQKYEGKFVFTADVKLAHLREDGSYLIRIPYQKDYIRVNENEVEWIKKDKTLRIVLPVDHKVMHYDENMVYQDRINVEDLKIKFEEKNKSQSKQKKKKLRFKVPDGKRIIREESLGEEYTFDSINERIRNNFRNKNDPEIEETIRDANDFEKTEAHRKRAYDFADIHITIKTKTVYRSQRQEYYFKWKESQIDRMVDQINRETLANRDLSKLNDLRDWRYDLNEQLKECYRSMDEFDKQMDNIMKDHMENQSMPEGDAIDEFIRTYRGPLEQKAEDIKMKIKDCSYRIKEAERCERLKNQNRERVRTR